MRNDIPTWGAHVHATPDTHSGLGRDIHPDGLWRGQWRGAAGRTLPAATADPWRGAGKHRHAGRGTGHLASLGEPYASADLENGRRLFRRCASCHTLGSGDRHLVGPNLHGMFGREVGGAEGFRFSRHGGGRLCVDEGRAGLWLANPRTYLPGNRMSFAGLRTESDRNDLIAFTAVETAR